jgi:release factor glutamine methyltransferase
MIAQSAMPTLSLWELRRQACSALKAAGIENPAQETDWLLVHALGVSLDALLLEGDREVSSLDVERAWSLISRRAAREPLQYLLGTQEFRGLDLVVTPAVLIPRPETECLVEETLLAVTGLRQPFIADVGTGSGCIAVSILRECPTATVYASDISAKALAIVQGNADRHGVSLRLRLIQADLLGAFSASGGGPFDVIVSNPPYIPAAELERLQPEVSRYEPRLALAAGPDGLAFHRRLLEEAPPLLKPGGFLVLELGAGQAETVLRMARRVDDFDLVECRNDAAGIERVLVACRAERLKVVL